jgi:hypothetical protein
MYDMKRQWLILIGALVIVVGIIIAYRASQQDDMPIVTDFASCAAAGNPIMESYPEQCAHDGKTYTNPGQEPVNPPPTD